MTEILVVGDAHATTGVSNERFDWLGNIIIDRRPDVIISMGDFADCESLSTYDKGKKDFEGRRFNLDIEVCKDALARINRPLIDHNDQCRQNKKSQYRPRKIQILGNHDAGRLARVVQMHPELDGVLHIDQFGYQEAGWEVIPYTVPVCVDGVFFCHHFPSGVKGEPIGGVNVAASLVAKNLCSSVVGHNHMLDFHLKPSVNGKSVWGISAGCYFDHPMKYALSTEFLWWRGLIFLHNVSEGDFDIETIALKEIKRRYSN